MTKNPRPIATKDSASSGLNNTARRYLSLFNVGDTASQFGGLRQSKSVRVNHRQGYRPRPNRPAQARWTAIFASWRVITLERELAKTQGRRSLAATSNPLKLRARVFASD